MTERFNYIMFNSRLRNILKVNGLAYSKSDKIYNICQTYHTNMHTTPSLQNIQVPQKIQDYEPALLKETAQKIYKIFKDSFELLENIENQGILVSKVSEELVIVYDFLSRTQKRDPIDNFDYLNNTSKIEIDKKAQDNMFSDNLTNHLKEYSDFIVYLDKNILEINNTSSIDPEKIANAINTHIKFLLPNYKGKSATWREDLFWGVIDSWKIFFHDHDYKCVDKMIVYFFEKCSIFTDTITMDNTKNIPK